MVQNPTVDRQPPLRGWAEPPWTCQSPQWLAIDADLPPDHLARRIVPMVERLDLTPLYQTYMGRGSLPHRPDVMLQVVLYEMQRGRHRPAQWAEDFLDSRSVSWVAMGMRVSRARCDAFRERLAPLLDQWHHDLLHQAIAMGLSDASRSALDGSSVAAHASRHTLLNAENLERRMAILVSWLASDSVPPAEPGAASVTRVLADPAAPAQPMPTPAPESALGAPSPGLMVSTPQGRQLQQRRYEVARAHLHQRQVQHQQRPADKRKPEAKVLISPGDPEAPLDLDKTKVYRPLYNVQVSRDLNSPLILAHDVFAQPTDTCTLGLMLERQRVLTGRLPMQTLTDAGYVTALDLVLCAELGVELYATYQDNDFSAAKRASTPPKPLPKSAFTWLAPEQTYQSPQGHRLPHEGRERQQQAGGQHLEVSTYRCPAVHCRACPQQATCAKNPQAGLTMQRSEHEDVVEALQARMATAEAKALYKLRKQPWS